MHGFPYAYPDGDPVARVALDIIHNRGIGHPANSWLDVNNNLRFSWDWPPVSFGPPRTDATYHQIGVKLMQAHVEYINRHARDTGMLSVRRITEYHHEVFTDLGLPARAFGGTPLTGTKLEAGLTSLIWYDACQ